MSIDRLPRIMPRILPRGSALRRSLAISAVLLASLGVSSIGPAEAKEGVEGDLSIERELLADAQRRYDRARDQQSQSQVRVEQLQEHIDSLLQLEDPVIPDLEGLEAALAVSRGTTRALADQADEARRTLLGHHRRIAQLESALEALAKPQRRDPISGVWVILVRPSGQEGVLELQLEGALVTGQYRLDGGFEGSLRGTFVNRRLELERIDSRHGFDVVYEGALAQGGGRIDGRWRSTRLNAPGAAGGQWRATRREVP